MINTLKPYPAFKDSGVPWVGEVPKHWDVTPNRATFVEIRERGFPDEEMLSITIAQGVVRQSVLLAGSSKKDSSNEDRSNYKLVSQGDIAYNKMRAWQGAVGVSRYRGIVSPAYVVMRPRGIQDSRYWHYLLRTPAFAKEAERWSYGISSDQWSLRPEEFKRIYSCVPPPSEQAAIVRFLGHADRRIKRYILTKRKLITRLNEQKQAIIHQTVTRGLDRNVSLSPSGVDWIGGVPSHWCEANLGRCLRRIDQGWSPVAQEGDVRPDQWVVLTLSAVRRGVFDPTAIKPISPSVAVPTDFMVEEGDLLVTRSNTRELVGDACIVREVRYRTIIPDLIYRLRCDASMLDATFLMYVLLSRFGRQQIERDARGSSGTMPKIAQRHIRSWRVLIPPLGEQRAISSWLNARLHNIEASIRLCEREVRLVQEYRTRLIADVVTGKLDVRAVAAQLPDEPDEPKAPEDADVVADAEDVAQDEELVAAAAEPQDDD